MKCLLDMDGVLVDFVRGACQQHNRCSPYPEFKEWDFVNQLGLTAAQFWKPLGREFWANLPWTKDGKELLRIIEDRFGEENICLLSSPCMTEGCLEGKLDWVKKHIPQYKRSFLFGSRKEFCAHNGTVLIDDYDKNIESFQEHGGEAVLVPRPWNRDRLLFSQASVIIYQRLYHVSQRAMGGSTADRRSNTEHYQE